MKIRLRYFASIREALSLGQETWETQAASVAELRHEIGRAHV